MKVIGRKFKLDERFILDERFVLTEAEPAENAASVNGTEGTNNSTQVQDNNASTETVTTSAEQTTNKKQNSKQVSSEAIKNAQTAAKTKIQNTIYEINNKLKIIQNKNSLIKSINSTADEILTLSDATQIKTKLTAIKTSIKNTLQNISKYWDQQYPEVVKILSELDKYINQLDGTAEVGLAKQSAANILKQLSNELLKNEGVSSDVNSQLKAWEDIKTTLTNLIGPVANENSIVIDNLTANDTGTLDVLNKFAKIPSIAAGKYASNDPTKFMQYINSLKDMAETAITDKNTKVSDAETAEDEKLISKERKTSKEDWQTKFNEAEKSGKLEEVDKVWDDYYKIEWPKDEKNIRNLGEAFRVELQYKGFDEETNPFITFVKTLFNKGIYPNSNAYGTIHNAYVQGEITNKVLQGNGILADHNIIFNKSLYTKSPSDILEYLEIWHNAIQSSNNNKYANKVIKQRYDGDQAQFMKDLFWGKPWTTRDQYKKADDAATEGPLRSLRDIEVDFKSIFNEEATSTHKNNTKPFNIEKLEPLIKNDKELAKNMIRYIISNYVKTNASDINKIYKDAGMENDSKALDTTTVPKLSKLLNYKIEQNNVGQYTKEIAEKAGLIKPKEQA